jgi:CheY-like chemotaxis protein
VDDEEFCISSMRAVLYSLGINVDYQTDFCIHGKEALNQVKKTNENGMRYSIIFTDFSMPVMDGIESTTKIRSYLKFKNVVE